MPREGGEAPKAVSQPTAAQSLRGLPWVAPLQGSPLPVPLTVDTTGPQDALQHGGIGGEGAEFLMTVRLRPPHSGSVLVREVSAAGSRVTGGGLGEEGLHSWSLRRTGVGPVGDVPLQQTYRGYIFIQTLRVPRGPGWKESLKLLLKHKLLHVTHVLRATSSAPTAYQAARHLPGPSSFSVTREPSGAS